MTKPADRCGARLPQLIANSPQTECVLPPNHQGSHADENDTRWWPSLTAATEPLAAEFAAFGRAITALGQRVVQRAIGARQEDFALTDQPPAEFELRGTTEIRAIAYRDAADIAMNEASRLYDDMGQEAAAGARAVADRLRRMADEAQQAEPALEPAVTMHACPGPDDNGISPCCNRPPFEFRGERLTRDLTLVTCVGAPKAQQP
ncbi:hypothetical protein ACNYS0_21100 [Streptomyces sp. BH034]|uniref:hypothetical protein n=1 Tax=Streptomyces sp. BH034 TaxID=3402626 RepID=UPI003BB64E43